LLLLRRGLKQRVLNSENQFVEVGSGQLGQRQQGIDTTATASQRRRYYKSGEKKVLTQSTGRRL